MTLQATQHTITIAGVEFVGFQIGTSYLGSAKSAEIAIGKSDKDLRRWLASNKATIYKNTQLEKVTIAGAAKPITGVPLEIIAAYWRSASEYNNPKAIALTEALVTEAFQRRFDHAVGIEVSMEQVEQKTSNLAAKILKQYERIASTLASIEACKASNDSEGVRLYKAALNDLYGSTDPLAHDLANAELSVTRAYEALGVVETRVEKEKYRNQAAYANKEVQRLRQAIASC